MKFRAYVACLVAAVVLGFGMNAEAERPLFALVLLACSGLLFARYAREAMS